MTPDMLPWIIAAASLFVLLVAVIASARAQRQLRLVHEESIATRKEQIASLEAQIASLRESESIRFVDRYVASKKGLEERIANLQEQLETTRQQQGTLKGELDDLGLSERERESETDRLLRDLNRTTDQVKRLEHVLQEVASVGPMDVETIRMELDGRRELATHIRERVERLSFMEQDRHAARRSATLKLEKLTEEVAQLQRQIEITRAASSIVDGILGIDSVIRKRLARHASDHIDAALQSLGDASRRNPISQFVDILEQQRPERLLERGRPEETENEEPEHATPASRIPEQLADAHVPIPAEPPAAESAAPNDRASNSERVAGPDRAPGSERASGSYWTTLP